MVDQGFPAQLRIRRGTDFRRAYRRRVTAGDSQILVFGCENHLPHPRLGLSVSRKIGGAVARNRWKRLIREAFRLTRPQLPPGVDLVVIPRQGVEPELQELMKSLPRSARRVAAKLARSPQ